jgi:hypothetical protein
MGQTGELVKLVDGSLWEVGPSFLYLYAYFPAMICPSTEELLVERH